LRGLVGSEIEGHEVHEVGNELEVHQGHAGIEGIEGHARRRWKTGSCNDCATAM